MQQRFKGSEKFPFYFSQCTVDYTHRGGDSETGLFWFHVLTIIYILQRAIQIFLLSVFDGRSNCFEMSRAVVLLYCSAVLCYYGAVLWLSIISTTKCFMVPEEGFRGFG